MSSCLVRISSILIAYALAGCNWINPPACGNPKQVRDMLNNCVDPLTTPKSPQYSDSQISSRYRVVLRVHCVDTKDGTDRGYQDIEGTSTTSCASAEDNAIAKSKSKDHCREVRPNHVDNTRKAAQRTELITTESC